MKKVSVPKTARKPADGKYFGEVKTAPAMKNDVQSHDGKYFQSVGAAKSKMDKC